MGRHQARGRIPKCRSNDRFVDMSLDFKFSLVPPGASLDDRSRRVMRAFALQLCIGFFVVLGPCILGMRPWDGAAQLLALIFSLNGLVTFSRLRPGEKDSWDRASISGTWPSPSTDALPCSEQSCINQHESPLLAREPAPLFTDTPLVACTEARTTRGGQANYPRPDSAFGPVQPRPAHDECSVRWSTM